MAIDLGQETLPFSQLSDMAPVPMETTGVQSKKPAGFLEGQYHITIGNKTLTVSKRAVWGTVGTATVVAIISTIIMGK